MMIKSRWYEYPSDPYRKVYIIYLTTPLLMMMMMIIIIILEGLYTRTLLYCTLLYCIVLFVL